MTARELPHVGEARTGALRDDRDVRPAPLPDQRLDIHDGTNISESLRFVNSILRAHTVSSLLLNAGMDVKAIRHLNLEGLIAMHEGKINRLARATKTSANYISQLRGDDRGMGHAFARKLESAMKKPNGWMDAPQFEQAAPEPDQARGLRILSALSGPDLDAWLKHGELLMASGKPPEDGEE
jgi:hypothetical protein